MSYQPKERENPLTSILAHESVKPDKEAVHRQIVKALDKLKVGGISEEIAAATGLEHAQIWKRLSEMRDKAEPLVYNVGTTRKGSKGRDCLIWQLTKFGKQLVPAKTGVQMGIFS